MKRSARRREITCLRSTAFLFILTGTGGIAGAIETGTSPVNAIVVFLTGCLTMAAYIEAESISIMKKEFYGKEKVMSGFEKEELQTRTKGMPPEEQAVVAETLPDAVLLEELCRRYGELREKVDSISRAVNRKEGDSRGV